MSDTFTPGEEESSPYLDLGGFAPPQKEPRDSSEVIESHRALLESRVHMVISKEGDPKEIKNLAVTSFEGIKFILKDEQLYGEGMDMTLWDVDGRLVLVSTSEDVSMVGAIRRRDGRIDVMDYQLSMAEYNDNISPQLEVLHRADQNLEQLLRNWQLFYNAGKTDKALEEYLRLIRFRINGQKSSARWFADSKLKNPLLLLTHSAMQLHLNRRWRFDNNPLIKWLEKETDITA